MLRSILLGAGLAATLFGVATPPGAAAALKYTMKDYGSPPASLLAGGNSTPITFNNTGQLAGLGSTAADPGQDCIAYTGSKWIVAQQLTARICTPDAMSDLHGGTFDIVGSIGSEYESGPLSAFYTVATASAATMHLYGFAAGSSLSSVARGGVAVGSGVYSTPATVSGLPALVFSSSGTSFAPLYPCVTLAPLCPGAIASSMSVPGNNGFNVRSINASNTYIALDVKSNYVMEATVGNASASFDLPIDPSLACYAPIGIDDLGRFFYKKCESATSSHQYVYRYDPARKQITRLPPLAGSDCLVYAPYAVNGKGQVLGITQSCTKSGPVLWLYDPVAMTTSNLSGQLPAGTYTIEAMNDLGQILVDLTGLGGPDHWAILSPPK